MTVRQLRSPKQYYTKMPKAQKQCRGRRFHRFPDLDPTAPALPAGFRVQSHDRRGRYIIEKQCENDCGVSLWGLYVWRRGSFALDARPWYSYPDNWVRVPRGLLSPAAIRTFLMNECYGLIVAAAQQSA